MEKRVLYAVLNWGLGHATRSVPIIESLLHFGARVEIASSGQALSYLKKRFPLIPFHELPDREVLYSKYGAQSGLLKRALAQPGINTNQHTFTRKIVDDGKITHIVSDNVYGSYDQRIPTALISHQLSLKLPFGESLINAKLAGWINRFSEVWIPDGSNQLVAGDLASNPRITIPQKYLGVPSRFSPGRDIKKNYSIGVVLGGPEPQRSILEERLLNILATCEGSKIIFRGSGKTELLHTDKIEIRSLGDGEEMARVLAACELVIGRSGYSTVCDLLAIGAKALLIPTPGQTEQMYLAERMSKLPQFSTCNQEKLSEDVVLSALKKHGSVTAGADFFSLDNQIVRDFLL